MLNFVRIQFLQNLNYLVLELFRKYSNSKQFYTYLIVFSIKNTFEIFKYDYKYRKPLGMKALMVLRYCFMKNWSFYETILPCYCIGTIYIDIETKIWILFTWWLKCCLRRFNANTESIPNQRHSVKRSDARREGL